MNFLKLSVTFVKSLSALFVPGKCPKRIDHEKNVAGESLSVRFYTFGHYRMSKGSAATL